MTPADELAALGAFYGLPVVEVLARHAPALARYAEWVLGRDDLAVVTLGDVETLAALATPTAAARLRGAAARWPEAITGVKLELGEHRPPTLYVRTLCPWQDGVDWLERAGIAAARVPPARTLYGLGFQGDLVKTYALAPDGFVSYRIAGGELRRDVDHKRYRADVAWEAIAWPDARWAAIGALGRTLGFRTAGHVGRTCEHDELKIYVERAGAIATDRSFA